jgi:hypothetical protein
MNDFEVCWWPADQTDAPRGFLSSTLTMNTEAARVNVSAPRCGEKCARAVFARIDRLLGLQRLASRAGTFSSPEWVIQR